MSQDRCSKCWETNIQASSLILKGRLVASENNTRKIYSNPKALVEYEKDWARLRDVRVAEKSESISIKGSVKYLSIRPVGLWSYAPYSIRI